MMLKQTETKLEKNTAREAQEKRPESCSIWFFAVVSSSSRS